MRISSTRYLIAARDGATLVEFALLAPLVLMFVFGSIEFGRLLWTREALQQTAIAGARCMAIAQGKIQNSPCASGGSYSATSTTTYIQNVATGWGLSVLASGISLNNAATCGGTSGFSQVTITFTFNSVVPKIVLLAVGGTLLTLTSCYPNNPF